MKILIVENDEFLASTIAMILLDENHEAEFSVDINDALRKVEISQYDLVTLDLRMNGKDRSGLEVYEKIRSLPWGSNVAIVVITGCDDEMFDDAKKIELTDPNYAIYQKPIHIEELREIVEFGARRKR